MTRIPLALALLLAFSAWLKAQVTAEVVLDQDEYLRDESLPVKVRITNRSGQALRLGKTDDWLTFSIESREGHPVLKQADLALAGEFTLESAAVATRQVDLMPFFDLSQPGRYAVRASLKLPEWREEISSPPSSFQIVRGTKVWEQEFGVPDSGTPPEVRKYALQQAPSLKDHKLYLRLTDASENGVLRVFPLGQIVSFSRPEAQVDKTNCLHVLFQTGARSFRYSVINPDGEVTVRQTHFYARTRPTLRLADEGAIRVEGGERRLSADDFPALRAAGVTNHIDGAKP